MIAAAAGGRRDRSDTARRALIAGGACALSVLVAAKFAVPSLLIGLGGVAFAGIAVWMFLSEKLELPCIALALYLGMVDGFAKLATGSPFVTLGRDVLLYALVAGVLVRASLRGQRLSLPPLGAWVSVFVVLVLVQLLNPANVGIVHTLSGLKPELEFVPLFFVGYAVLQTRERLRVFMLILLVCATANGIAGFVQLNLTPQQLAAWGPGYASKVNGTGDVAGRVFSDTTGIAHVRPFGLGGDAGAGAVLGVVGLGAALALLAAPRRVSPRLLLVLCIGPPLAIITGQGRTPVIAGIVALLAFVLLATSAPRLVPTLAAVLLGIGITLATISVISGSSNVGVYDRYKTIAPKSLVATTQKSRGTSISEIPQYMVAYPFGGGLGFVGPAAHLSPTTQLRGLNGETSPTFLLSELGLAGLIFMLAFNARLLLGAAARVRRMDPETRILVSGVAAGIAGLLAMWPAGPTTVQSPSGPYFWFAAGVLAFWIARPLSGRADRPDQRGDTAPAPGSPSPVGVSTPVLTT